MCNRNFILFLSILFLLCSCDERKTYGKYALQASDSYLTFPIDGNTRLPESFVSIFEEDGKEFLTFPNRRYEILIYELESGKLEKKVNFEKEGVDAIERIEGYLMTSFSHICIPAPDAVIAVTDTTAKIKRRIKYGKATNNDVVYCFPKTSIHRPLYLINDSLYLPQILNRTFGDDYIGKSPLCVVVDTTTLLIRALPLKYESVITPSEVPYSVGSLSYSYCYNEKDFIFSYKDSEFLIKVSPEGQIIDKYLAKSRYIDKPFVGANKNWDMQKTIRLNCEIPTYGNLIYDKYRKLYYRFVFPKTEMEDGEDYMEIIHNGRKLFSIMVLDEDLNVLGETIFPEYTYNPNIFFISRNGLYLSVSHFKRPDFDENVLRFQRIELMEL